MFLPHPRVKVSIVGSLRDREVAFSASDRQGSNFESCVWRTVSSQSSHHPQEVLLARFSLHVHKVDLKPYSFHFIYLHANVDFRFKHYNAEIFLYEQQAPSVFRFEIIINISRGQSLTSIGRQILTFNPYNAGIDFSRQNLTSVDVRF